MKKLKKIEKYSLSLSIYIYIEREREWEREKIDRKVIQGEGEIYWETKLIR